MTISIHVGLINILLEPLRQWLEKIEINNHEIAHVLCKVIPPYCPFERDIQVFGNKLFHIPPLCKLNPLYEQIVSLRFKSLCYLADICGEDITIQNGLRPAALTKFTH